MSAPFDLTGRAALVTGSSRGLGLALATGLLEAGAAVVLNGSDAARLNSSAEALRDRFGPDRVAARAFDVTDQGAVRAGIAWIEESVGALDVVVNNAGVQHREPLLDLDVADWDRVLRSDLTSAFLVGREAARAMVGRGRGKIVNIGSVQSDLARAGIGAYTAAKGGIRTLTRAMAAEWAGHGVQVNALAPGYLETEMTSALRADTHFDDWLRTRTPAGRWGTVSDVVGPLVWLCSTASDFVNGQTVFVDGGLTAVV